MIGKAQNNLENKKGRESWKKFVSSTKNFGEFIEEANFMRLYSGISLSEIRLFISLPFLFYNKIKFLRCGCSLTDKNDGLPNRR